MTAKPQFAVIGNPIKHSLSPQIHHAFAQQVDIDLHYDKLTCEPDDFEKTVKSFFAQGGKGMNVTLPFKEQAFELVDSLTERARHCGAVNTLALQKDGSILGDNTDGAGLLADITHKNIVYKNKKILVLGAGGAARGIIPVLLMQGVAEVILLNRTYQKALKLAEKFSLLGKIQASKSDEINLETIDLIINTCSVGAEDLLGEKKFNANVYDISYGERAESFLNFCQQHGAKNTFDGFGMLVEQAAESFYVWHGVRVDTKNFDRKCLFSVD